MLTYSDSADIRMTSQDFQPVVRNRRNDSYQQRSTEVFKFGISNGVLSPPRQSQRKPTRDLSSTTGDADMMPPLAVKSSTDGVSKLSFLYPRRLMLDLWANSQAEVSTKPLEIIASSLTQTEDPDTSFESTSPQTKVSETDSTLLVEANDGNIRLTMEPVI